jgi:hypothetical protein
MYSPLVVKEGINNLSSKKTAQRLCVVRGRDWKNPEVIYDFFGAKLQIP